MPTRRQCLIMLPLLLPSLAGASPSLQQAMQRARALRDDAVRTGDQAYGAVVLRGAQIVGEAPSRVVTAEDPTAHAEMEAIATRRGACAAATSQVACWCPLHARAACARPRQVGRGSSAWCMATRSPTPGHHHETPPLACPGDAAAAVRSCFAWRTDQRCRRGRRRNAAAPARCGISGQRP